MTKDNLKTILYTSPTYFEQEIEVINHAFSLGLDFLYIRKPELDDFSLVDFIEQLPEEYWSRCISSSLIITKEFNLGGYHFTRELLNKNDNYNQRILEWLHSNNKISSISAHTIDELTKYSNYYKHIIVSPIFDSISKRDQLANWNYSNIKSIFLQRFNSTFFAVGGVCSNNIDEVKSLNFNGVGLLGAIWNSNSPKSELENIFYQIKKYK